MPEFAQVAVIVPGVKDLFDYHIPESILGDILPGCLVEVPFGRQQVQGVVISLSELSAVPETRPVTGLLDDLPVLTGAQIALAQALSSRYLAPVSEFLQAMLPAGLSQRADTLYQLNLPAQVDLEGLSSLQQKIIQKLTERGGLRGRQLDTAFRHVDWRKSIRGLVRQGYLTSRPVLPEPSVKRKSIRTVALAPGFERISGGLESIGKIGSKSYERRKAVLELLMQEESSANVSYVYAVTDATSVDLKTLANAGLIRIGSAEVMRDPLAGYEAPLLPRPVLTEEQAEAWGMIENLLDKQAFSQPVLLHGVTGSGKTEIYLRAVESVLASGMQAIVLVPEISLTPQAIQRFLSRFPDQVGILHSRLSAGERYDTWRRARSGEISIMVGPRSALFTPFPRLGIIILDECHDDSYYQTDMPPYYHAVEAAELYGTIAPALVLMGSATPPVDLVFRANREKWPILTMPKRILAHQAAISSLLTRPDQNKTIPQDRGQTAASLPLPHVEVVDMREELKTGNRSIFSRKLQLSLEQVLDNSHQAILLLNRRGAATYVFCRDCGHSLRCPRCDLPLTYHTQSGDLNCHTCGYKRQMPSKCPRCGSTRIRQYGIGTETVEKALQDMFPQVRTLRWDADTSRSKGASDIILSHFQRHQADVLVGTQMLAKGHDLPLVTLVGVVLADVGLNFPDYRASERTFQLLTQVAGRAGRSALGGEVILQTFQPEHVAIRMAANHDFDGFFQQELESRRQLSYPPFVTLVRLEVNDLQPDTASHKAEAMESRIAHLVSQGRDRTLQIVGPVPPFFAKRAGKYRWQILLKGKEPERILEQLDLEGWRVEINPPSLL